jgi:hypothetical protein
VAKHWEKRATGNAGKPGGTIEERELGLEERMNWDWNAEDTDTYPGRDCFQENLVCTCNPDQLHYLPD